MYRSAALLQGILSESLPTLLLPEHTTPTTYGNVPTLAGAGPVAARRHM